MELALRRTIKSFEARPKCPSCGDVSMWLIKVDRPPGGEIDRLHFECIVCEAKAVIPPLD